MKTNSTLIVMTPKERESDQIERTVRFDDKTQEFLEGYITALEEVMDNYNIYVEKI